jgi:hypothetical protein
MSQFPTVPEVVPGETVATPPKNPFASSAVWALGMAYLNHRIAKAVANGTLPEFLAPLMANAVFEIGMYVVSAVLLLWGRWGKVARPLGFGSAPQKALVKVLPLILLAGCMTRAEHAAVLDRVETAATNAADENVDLAEGVTGRREYTFRTDREKDVFVKARERRRDELKATFEQARDQASTQPAD